MRRARGFVVRGRTWPSRWMTNRDCVCPPRGRIVEEDGSCYACGGRVVQRAPFRADGWSRDG